MQSFTCKLLLRRYLVAFPLTYEQVKHQAETLFHFMLPPGNCVTGAPLLPKSPCVDTTGAGKCVQGRCDCTAYEEKYVCQRCNVLSQMEADGTHSGYRWDCTSGY